MYYNGQNYVIAIILFVYTRYMKTIYWITKRTVDYTPFNDKNPKPYRYNITLAHRQHTTHEVKQKK